MADQRHVLDGVRSGMIPAHIYNDAEIFQLEKERIFSRAWLFVAHESEIPQDGDYVVRRVLDDSFIIARDSNGEVRAMFNMCLHRGMQVCRAEMGNASNFRCPYHGWSYRNDGRIIRAADGSLERIVERKDATEEMQKSVHEFNVGVYCFDGTQLIDALKKIKDENNAGEYYLTDVFLHLRPVTIVRLDDPGEAMGVKDRIRLAQAAKAIKKRILDQHMLAGVTIVDPDSTFVDAAVTIGQDTVIEPFTVIKGRSSVGSDCRIGPHVHIEDAKIGDRSDCGPFAKLRPGTEIADDVHVGSFTELVRTKVGRASKVPHVSYLGDADVGEGVNIGAGTITANFDGTNKNRTKIGDGAFVGVDTMLVAPVKLGRQSRTGAGSVVTKDVPDGATAVGVPARVVRRKVLSSDSPSEAK